MKAEKRDTELLELKLKMSQKLKLINRLKCTTAKHQEELADKDNSIKKMKEHIKRIWNFLFAFRSKLEQTGQLTSKEKNELGHEYEEFLTFGISEFKGKSRYAFNMLNDINENSTNFFNRSENSVKNSCSDTNGATGTEKNATPSNYASSVLQSQIVTVSSSNDSLEKNYQSLEDNTPQAPKFLGTESSSPCSPDTMNHENRSYIHTKESFSGVFSHGHKSLSNMPLQECSMPLLLDNFTSLGEIQNMHGEMEHSPEERSCIAGNCKPFIEPLSVEMPNGNKLVEDLSVQMSQASQEKEVSFKMTGSKGALSESIYEDIAMSDEDSILGSDLNPGETSNEEDSDKDLSFQMGLIGNEHGFQQKIQSLKNGAVSDCVSPEPVVGDCTLSERSIQEADDQLNLESSSLSDLQDATSLSVQKETEMHTIFQHKDLASTKFQKGIQQSDMDNYQTGISNESVESTTIKSLEYAVATNSKNDEVSPSIKLLPKEQLDSANIRNEINFFTKKKSLNCSTATEALSSNKKIVKGNFLNYIKHTNNTKKGKNGRLQELFQNYRRISFSPVNIEHHSRILVKIATNPNLSLDVSILLFHIFNYLHKSQKNPLLCFSSTREPSCLLPGDESCIVTALFSMELKKTSHLEGLLRTTLTATHNLILSKKGFNLLGLASLCRFLTEICRRQGNSVNPVILCADLLKMRHKFAAYLTASVAGVWPELFQIGNKLQAEEVLFHSSILYGASKRNKEYTECSWDNSINIVSKYFTAPSVNNARSAISNIKRLIEIRCKNSSWNSKFLMSALVILASHEDWNWIKEHLLNKFIIPNLTKFGCETLNEHAFDLFCNLYVDVILLKPQNPLDTVLIHFFNSPETINGKHFVRDSAALALMRFVYQKNRKLPSFLSTWFKSNQQNPKVQLIKPIVIRRAMSENLKSLEFEDILHNEEVKADHPTNKENQESDDLQNPGVVDINPNLDSAEESIEEIEVGEESNEEIEVGEESFEKIEVGEESVEEIEVEKDNFLDDEETNKQMPKDCTLRCRSIRIGSYKVQPPKCDSYVEVILSRQSLSFQVPMLSEPNKHVRIFLEKEDIKKMFVHFGRSFRVISALTTPAFGKLVRKALHMISSEAQYFDPTAKDDKTQKLTFLIEALSEQQKYFIRKNLFGHEKVVEINHEAANELLVKSAPNQIQSKIGEITGQSENMTDESEEELELDIRSKLRKVKKGLSMQKTNESTTDKLEKKPSARWLAKIENISEEESLFEPSTDKSTTDNSDEELITSARKRKNKKKQSFLKQSNKLPAGKSQESYARSKIQGVKEVKSLLKGRTEKNTTNESKGGVLARAKTQTDTERKVYKRLFTQSTEESTTEEELCTRAKKQKINKNKRKRTLPTTTFCPISSLSIRSKKKEMESLSKQGTEDSKTDESKEETNAGVKIRNIKKMESLSCQRTENSETDESEEPFTEAKNSQIKVLDSLSKRRTEDSATDESEERPITIAINRKVKVVESCSKQGIKDSETDESKVETVARAKNSKIKTMERLSKQRTEDSATDESEEPFTKAKNSKVRVLESLSKQKTEDSSTDESEENQIARGKNRKVKETERLSKKPVTRSINRKVKKTDSLSNQGIKDSVTDESKEKPVTRAKYKNVKVMESLSKQIAEDSTVEESEDTSSSIKNLKVKWKESSCQQSMEASTSDELEEGWKSTKYPQETTTKSVKATNSSKVPPKYTFDNRNLPEGWTRGRIVRKSGKSKGRIDIYFYNSEGYKFRSKAELASYLKKTQSPLDLSVFDFTRKA